MFKFLICLIFFSGLVACQTSNLKSFRDLSDISSSPDKKSNEQVKEDVEESQSHAVVVEDEEDLVKLAKNLPEVAHVPIEERPEVDVWIRYFTGRGRDHMQLYLERSERYLDVMKSALKKAGLPTNLVYMAMIESGFNPRARSRANAVGYWQFIESTGRRYGLKIDSFIDERRDPFLSTLAAGKYLNDLYELFGSWYLAMASYNAGEYRVNRAMMKHFTRDFWKLKDKKSIPRETREYVPKFMAAQLISENPKKYGFNKLKYQEPIRFESVAIHQPVSLKKFAQTLSIDYENLKLLNPKYVSQYVPLSREGSTVLRVPVGISEKVTTAVITASTMARPKDSKTYIRYKVRWGDTLYSLARRNRTTINTIARMNKMSPRSTLRAGRVIKLPPRYSSSRRQLAQSTPKTNKQFHKVVKGESLGRLSKRYGVSVAHLKSWNNLKSPIIHPGQVLTLKNPNTPKVRTYVVRKGDTLISIAKKYKVQLVQLMRDNSLTFKSILRVGQTIVIPE